MPSEPITSMSPSLITGLALGASERLIDNLIKWESKFESADLEGRKHFLEMAALPICDSPWRQLLGKTALFLKP